ncbi:MAG: hypothetical protein ACE14P_02835 [Methanotrichaceae archaeon]
MRMILPRLLLLLLVMVIEGGCLSHDRYIINVDLPADIIRDMVISDVLPRGLIYKNDSLNITGADDFDEHLKGINDGVQDSTITWSFGRVNNTDNKDIQICFEAAVANTPGNRAGVTLHPNKASIKWRDSHGLHLNSNEAVPVEIVEPDLIIEKRIIPESASVGDNISCIISIFHSSKSGSDAFDADVTEYLPKGLAYIPGSMKISGEPSGSSDKSSPSLLIWHFDSIDSSWRDGNPIRLRYNATVLEGGSCCSKSALTWTSAQGNSPYERTYSSGSECCLTIKDKKDGLSISKAAPSRAPPGGTINYTIAYENYGSTIHNAIIREIYDSNTTFLSAHPAPDIGTDDLWTIGDLQQGASGRVVISARVKSSMEQGAILNNTAKITSEESSAAAEAVTIVMEDQPSLEINATSSSDLIHPGDVLNYTITFRNDGPGEAENVSITDIIDSHLQIMGSAPNPTRTWSDSAGTHLFWCASNLNTTKMGHGETGEIRLEVRLPPIPEHPDIDRISNIYKIDSDNAEGRQGSLETFVIHSLFIRKRADRIECAEGEVVNFTITYGNELAVEAKSAVITDSLTGMDYVYAVPVPEIEGNALIWKPGTLPPHTEGSILLCARIKGRPEIHLHEAQLVMGEGYVASNQKLSASVEPHEIVNYVSITATYLKKQESDSSSATIRLLDLSGSGLESVKKGSGSYDIDQTIDYRRGKSMSLNKEIHASYSPVKIPLAWNNLTVSSLWDDRTRAENGARNEAISENYRYMTHLDNLASFLMDKNQTVFASRSKFGSGLAQISYQRDAPGSVKDVVGISENYYGSFRLESRLDSYGMGVTYSRSSSGSGFVSSDKRALSGNAKLKSYEHGSGIYESSETITNDPTNIKNINLSSATNDWSVGSLRAIYADKWSEGISTDNFEFKSKIGEKIISGDYIQKEALMDSSSLSITSEFTGIGSLWAHTANEGIAVDETFAGKYRLDTAIGVYSIPKYLGPHISLTKEALKLDAETVLFRINVTNDGNKVLAPVEVIDILPETMIFFNSSYRSTASGRNISWSIISLSPGTTRTLDLRVKLIGPFKENRAKAIGHYSEEAVKAEASCAAFNQPRKVMQSSQYSASADWCTLPECTEECCTAVEDYGEYYDGDDEILCAGCV